MQSGSCSRSSTAVEEQPLEWQVGHLGSEHARRPKPKGDGKSPFALQWRSYSGDAGFGTKTDSDAGEGDFIPSRGPGNVRAGKQKVSRTEVWRRGFENVLIS